MTTDAADLATRALTDDLAAVLSVERCADVHGDLRYLVPCDSCRGWGRHVAARLAAHTTPDPDALRVRLAAVETVIVQLNAILNSYGIRGQLWHDLNAVLSPAVAALDASATHTTPDQQALTAAREAVAAASEVVAAARELVAAPSLEASDRAFYRLAAALGSAEVES